MSTINKYKTSLVCVLLPLTLCLTACKKFVEVGMGTDLIEKSMVFESDKTAISATLGVYTQLTVGNLNYLSGGASIYAGLSADEIYAPSGTTTTDQFFFNQLLPNNSVVNTQFYTISYKTIYQANAILEGITTSNSLTDSLRKQISGEMKFIRSLMYFYLAQFFGDVPLITTTDYQANSVMPRVPINDIYNQIEADLLDAKQLLKEQYPSSGKVRPNTWVATALLARVYLYRGEWANAEKEASELIQSQKYSLIPSANIAAVFKKNASETIWEIASLSDRTPTGEGSTFIPATATITPLYAITDSLLSTFETDDLRNSGWVGKNTVNGVDYYYPLKYRERSVTSGTSPTEYQIIFRLSEQYLIRAEAKAKQGNVTGPTGAAADLNVIRNRAGLEPTTAVTEEDIIKAIDHERRIEFFCELGHRWLDLKRRQTIDAVLGKSKGQYWQTTDALWPIPQQEITYNPFLTQNPGY